MNDPVSMALPASGAAEMAHTAISARALSMAFCAPRHSEAASQKMA